MVARHLFEKNHEIHFIQLKILKYAINQLNNPKSPQLTKNTLKSQLLPLHSTLVSKASKTCSKWPNSTKS